MTPEHGRKPGHDEPGLHEDTADDPAEVERAWEEEIRRRLAELDAGTAELIPADRVFAELRSRRRDRNDG
ncbi:MAG: addiction module protein [Gemmatimonadota bacterium]